MPKKKKKKKKKNDILKKKNQNDILKLKDRELKDREVKIKTEIEQLFLKPIMVSADDMDKFE